MIAASDERLRRFETPYHYPRPVLHGSGKPGSFDEKAVDIPFVFWHLGKYYMVYSGFDGIGYQSALAVSEDLVNWEYQGLILKRQTGSGRWDENGGAVTWMIKESDDLYTVPKLGKVDGKYWLVYHSYPGNGYEAGAAEIGLAWTEDETLLTWHFLDQPVFSWKDGKDWENGGLYKACVVKKEDTWYLFYNAKTRGEHWIEQTGVATSKDLLCWKRYEENPIIRNGPKAWDSTFASDPYVVRDGKTWVCFYYGIGGAEEDGLYHAQNGAALSEDLLHWEKAEEPLLRHGMEGSFDHHHAHKPAIFYENGVLYQFYCGTCEKKPEYPTELFGEYRTICMASSQKMEKFVFQRAKPVWAKGREKEKNLELAFRAELPKGKGSLLLAASSIYRVWVNGVFVGAGPSRAAHGYYVVSTYDLEFSKETNVLVIEVLGYNVNSYDTLEEPSFLTAEVWQDGRILVYTSGNGFAAYDRQERIQKVQRYSFQRAFIDAYVYPKDHGTFYIEKQCHLQTEPETVQEEKKYLLRNSFLPEYPVISGMPWRRQRAEWIPKQEPAVKENAYFQTGKTVGGFSYEEETLHVSEEAQKIRYTQEIQREEPLPAVLEQEAQTFRFPYNAAGFYKIRIEAEKDSRVYVQFDELECEGDVNFLRMTSCNCFWYQLEKGRYELMSFAPYTMQYLKIVVNGKCRICSVELVEYKHRKVPYEVQIPEDPVLKKIYQAAEESFLANATDVFMDCPSRERGGWLCDSYFTSQTEFVLTGRNDLEHDFLENFLFHKKFAHLPEGMLPMCYPSDHNDGNFIPNWAMWFVLELEQYVKRTKDSRLAEKARDAVYRLAAYVEKYENEFELLENLDGWIFLEWSKANDEELVNGVNFPTNMLYTRMNQAVGTLYQDGTFLEKAKRQRQKIRERSLKGVFYTDHEERREDSWYNPGISTEVCQYYAFFCGVANEKEDAGLWKVLKEDFGPDRIEKGKYLEVAKTNAFIGKYLRIQLLFEQGCYEEVLDNIREYFYPMAERTGTLWEHDKPTGSCCHGFASYVICWLAGIFGTRRK